MNTPFVIGRAILDGFFLYNGINHFKNRKMLAGYAGSKGIPNPGISVPATGALLLLGGASVALGVYPKLGVAALIAFLASVSPTIHAFWQDGDPNQRMADMINFSKNTALAGATLALLGVEEPWPVSVPVPR
jgi:uncharacterized membrane protein YphA (DoxX/SURF4 family)